jgi:NADP-dependent 3-hydroxy acid dehydrogenase YdfG
MNDFFTDKVVVTFGATGGLGTAVVRSLQAQATHQILAGRREALLQQLVEEIGASATYVCADVTSAEDIHRVYQHGIERYGKIDIVINVSGVDVRGPLVEHMQRDMDSTVSVNLLGAILITQGFLLHTDTKSAGVVVHIGGFADGRLAFPFYSVNAASRAGLRTFVESVNREMRVLKRNVLISYFGPTSADTEAERPFHPIWREMGISIEKPEVIAMRLLQAVASHKQVYTMGFSARLLAQINALSPSLADCIIMNRYSEVLKRRLNPSSG